MKIMSDLDSDNLVAGDRLLCKKTEYDSKTNIGIIKDKYYIISKIDDKIDFDVVFNPKNIFRFLTISDGIITYTFSLYFFNNKKIKYVWDYFYTKKELRSEKMKKLK